VLARSRIGGSWIKARCPACLYSLREIETGIDEITTCPECGAGWDMRPIGPTEVVVVRGGVDGGSVPVAATIRPHYQRREIKRPATIVASTGLPPSS
jgi:Zn-finger nucleic acid-binding protein